MSPVYRGRNRIGNLKGTVNFTLRPVEPCFPVVDRPDSAEDRRGLLHPVFLIVYWPLVLALCPATGLKGWPLLGPDLPAVFSGIGPRRWRLQTGIWGHSEHYLLACLSVCVLSPCMSHHRHSVYDLFQDSYVVYSYSYTSSLAGLMSCLRHTTYARNAPPPDNRGKVE